MLAAIFTLYQSPLKEELCIDLYIAKYSNVKVQIYGVSNDSL